VTNESADRSYVHTDVDYDVVVVGGGMAGIAAAVTAARGGARTALIQERPVLGGNASTEVRVNLEGANGGVHNRFFVESGLAEDLLLENFWRNPTGSADHWGALLLELVLDTENLDLYLDTHAHTVELDRDRSIRTITALTLASERTWTFHARYWVDATGDGTIAFLAGAEFMRGEEARDTFDEPLAPAEATDYKLGGTMQFMCKDLGRPVEFTPPTFARKVTADELSVNRSANVSMQEPVLGGFWWIEYGGHLDTIHDNSDIKHTLLSEIFGVWDYIKNDPQWQEKNRTLDLEWVAALPGKRESRRIVGDHVLTELDITEGRRFDDAVAFGGWSFDNHAPLGFMDFERTPCTQVQPPGIYQIPLRSLYARDVPNLYLAGRDISCSHIACCSARVMLTCTTGGEAVGAAAALSAAADARPRELTQQSELQRQLRERLQRLGHYIPHVKIVADRPPGGAQATASSEARLAQPDASGTVTLDRPRLLSLPLVSQTLETIGFWLRSTDDFGLRWQVHAANSDGFWTPGTLLAAGKEECSATSTGGWVDLPIGVDVAGGYVHVAIAAAGADVELGVSDERPLGPLSWRSQVADLDAIPVDRRLEQRWQLPQESEADWGDSFAFPFSYWRRDAHGWGGPPGPGIAFRVRPEQVPGPASAVLEPFERPTLKGIHAWISEPQPGQVEDGRFEFSEPQWLAIEWPDPLEVEAIELYLNPDLDRHLANIWYSHPPGVRAMSTLLADFDVETLGRDGWSLAASLRAHHQRRAHVSIDDTIRGLRVTAFATNGERYASVMDVRVWKR
jgi:FAD dependent oxidoreductase